MQSHLSLCRHGFCDVNITLSKKFLDVYLRSESTELAEAVPIVVFFFLLFCCLQARSAGVSDVDFLKNLVSTLTYFILISGLRT